MADLGHWDVIQLMERPSEIFHEASNLHDSDVSIGRTVWSVNTSPSIRQIIARPASSFRGLPTIDLAVKRTPPEALLTQVLWARRSARTFTGQPLTLAEVSALMYYSAAVTQPR
jgi:hypothetical protein